MKTNITKKLFFKKYLYKLVVSTPKACYTKRWNRERFEKFVKPIPGLAKNHLNILQTEISANKNNLLKIYDLNDLIDGKYDFVSRGEYYSISYFTNDTKLINLIKKTLGSLVSEEWVPESDDSAKYLLDSHNKIITKELPHKNFKYKVHISTKHKIPLETRINFLEWQGKYDTKIHLPPSCLKMAEPTWYEWGKYFYVSDEKMLSLALMYLGKYVMRTEEYVLENEAI